MVKVKKVLLKTNLDELIFLIGGSSFLFMYTESCYQDRDILSFTFMIVKTPGPDIVYFVVFAVTKLQ